MKNQEKEGEGPQKRKVRNEEKVGEEPSVKREEFNGLARQNNTYRRTKQRITENQSGHIIG